VFGFGLHVGRAAKRNFGANQTCEDQVSFEILSQQASGETWIHSQGSLVAGDPGDASPASVDISAIQSRASHTRNGSDCYEVFARLGLKLGAGFRSIRQIWGNSDEALALLELPESRKSDFTDYVLHPSILDGALQAVTGIFSQPGDISLHLPFSLGAITLHRPLTENVYAYVTQLSRKVGAEGLYRFRISTHGSSGKRSWRIYRNFVRPSVPDAGQQRHRSTAIYQRTWQPLPFDSRLPRLQSRQRNRCSAASMTRSWIS